MYTYTYTHTYISSHLTALHRQSRSRANLPTFAELIYTEDGPLRYGEIPLWGPARKSRGDRGARGKAHQWPRIGTAPVMGS